MNKKANVTIKFTAEVGTTLKLPEEEINKLIDKGVADVVGAMEMALNKNGKLRWHMKEISRED